MHRDLSATASAYILRGAITPETSHLSILLQPGIKITFKVFKVSSIQLFLIARFLYYVAYSPCFECQPLAPYITAITPANQMTDLINLTISEP
jgi:hypothetical protein